MRATLALNGLSKKASEKVFFHAPFFFFNWDSLYARLNSHYEAWSYKKGSTKIDYRIQKICLERTYC